MRNRSIGYRLSPPHRRGESMCDHASPEKRLLNEENPEESDVFEAHDEPKCYKRPQTQALVRHPGPAQATPFVRHLKTRCGSRQEASSSNGKDLNTILSNMNPMQSQGRSRSAMRTRNSRTRYSNERPTVELLKQKKTPNAEELPHEAECQTIAERRESIETAVAPPA